MRWIGFLFIFVALAIQVTPEEAVLCTNSYEYSVLPITIYNDGNAFCASVFLQNSPIHHEIKPLPDYLCLEPGQTYTLEFSAIRKESGSETVVLCIQDQNFGLLFENTFETDLEGWKPYNPRNMDYSFLVSNGRAVVRENRPPVTPPPRDPIVGLKKSFTVPPLKNVRISFDWSARANIAAANLWVTIKDGDEVVLSSWVLDIASEKTSASGHFEYTFVPKNGNIEVLVALYDPYSGYQGFEITFDNFKVEASAHATKCVRIELCPCESKLALWSSTPMVTIYSTTIATVKLFLENTGTYTERDIYIFTNDPSAKVSPDFIKELKPGERIELELKVTAPKVETLTEKKITITAAGASQSTSFSLPVRIIPADPEVAVSVKYLKSELEPNKLEKIAEIVLAEKSGKVAVEIGITTAIPGVEVFVPASVYLGPGEIRKLDVFVRGPSGRYAGWIILKWGESSFFIPLNFEILRYAVEPAIVESEEKEVVSSTPILTIKAHSEELKPGESICFRVINLGDSSTSEKLVLRGVVEMERIVRFGPREERVFCITPEKEGDLEIRVGLARRKVKIRFVEERSGAKVEEEERVERPAITGVLGPSVLDGISYEVSKEVQDNGVKVVVDVKNGGKQGAFVCLRTEGIATYSKKCAIVGPGESTTLEAIVRSGKVYLMVNESEIAELLEVRKRIQEESTPPFMWVGIIGALVLATLLLLKFS